MLSLRASARLLAAAAPGDGLRALAAAIGFTARVATLDDDGRRSLGLGAEAHQAEVIAGPGALRALLLESRVGSRGADVAAQVAGRLSRRAPHALWLLLIAERDGSTVTLATWSAGERGPRVSAITADRTRPLDSDADTLRAMGVTLGDEDLVVHARWVDVLGRQALSRRFFRAFERAVATMAASGAGAPPDARAEIALLQASRLLFLAFLEARGWLDRDPFFLSRQFDASMVAGGGFHERVLRPLLFGTLNTPVRKRAPAALRFGAVPFLNGGLFSPTPLERRHARLVFSDESYGVLFGEVLSRFRFTAREATASLAEAAIDPEMLGHTFESLMATGTRRATGAFYTPQTLVSAVTRHGLDAALSPALGGDAATRALAEERLSSAEQLRLAALLPTLTVIDPACGSGAFLVHALDRLTALHRAAGDLRPGDAIRRELLGRAIFGVDLSPIAVWLCELRLWLSVVIDAPQSDPLAVPPLPNLDRNIRVGDSLAGDGFGTTEVVARGGTMRALRARYARSTGARKATLGRLLASEERAQALRAIDRRVAALTGARRELLLSLRARDLFGARNHAASGQRETDDLRRQLRAARALRLRISDGGALPFSFPTHFADVASTGGFSLVVGNPPWVRPHDVEPAARAVLRARFRVARGATWAHGADAAGAGSGFGSQVDLAAVFTERSLDLVQPGGALSMLVPAKLWRSLAGGGVRELLLSRSELIRLEDLTESPSLFDAAVYPAAVTARRPLPAGEPISTVRLAAPRAGRPSLEWRTALSRLPFDTTPGAPWIIAPRECRESFDVVRAAGMPLAESPLGRPLLGVKCGCNDAFLVELESVHGDEATVRARDGRRGAVERAMLRPALRGEALLPWTTRGGSECVLWTHDAHGAPLDTLPPLASRWLMPWRKALRGRSDARGSARWWTLFRTDAARHGGPRVVWADIGRAPRASVLHARSATVPLNSCYVAACRSDDDAHALAALLNSPVAGAWLAMLAEPARGGYRRYLGWTVGLLPVPANWERARDILAPLGERASAQARRGDGDVPPSAEILEAVLDAYGLRHRDVAPLLAWTNR